MAGGERRPELARSQKRQRRRVPPRRRRESIAALHQAAWPDMFASLQAAYAELTRTQFELERRTVEIEETRDLFERVVDSMSEALFLLDQNGRVVRMNHAAELLIDETEEQLTGRPLSDGYVRENIPTTPWQLLNRDPSGKLLDLDIEVVSRSGQQIPVSLSCALVRDKWEKITGVLVVARDISERKRAEEVQRFLADATTVLASSLDYQATLSSLARLAVPTLADWCVVDMLGGEGSAQRLAVAHIDPAKEQVAGELKRRFVPNLSAQHGLGYVLRTGKAELLQEIPDEVLVQTASSPEHLQLLRSLGLTSGMLVPLVVRNRTLGAITFVSAESGRRYSENDLAVAQELARRAAIAVDNARLYEETQRALHVRDGFLSIASHELKTPITALLGYAQLLQRQMDRDEHVNPRSQRALMTLIGQVQRLHRLINVLLDLSRIQSGRLTIDRAHFNLTELIRRVIDELQPTLERHTVQLECSESFFLNGDELRLEQVLQNLIHNAIKYSPSGGMVQVILARHQGQVQVLIRDEGIGIPADALSEIFGQFFRASNVDSQQISGMGIGLYLVKEIIALHGGTISVDSVEGQGSTFTIMLPIEGSAALSQSTVGVQNMHG